MEKIVFDKYESSLYCSFPRRMDTVSCTEYEKLFNEKTAPLKETEREDLSIVFDLMDVSYVSSCFFRLCISAAKMVKKDNFNVIHTDPQVMKTFKIAGLDKAFNIS
jgi:anti-anti-sigma factor